MNKRWRGTALFATILVTMGLTIGLKLYVGSGALGAGTAAAVTTPASGTAAGAAAGAASGSAQTASPRTGATASAPSAAATGDQTISGAVEQTPYGPIQVSVVFSGSRITAVTELQAPNDRQRSIEINTGAAPILAREVLSAQSATIDSVSGATYTSQGYAASVQAAIDKR